MLRSYWQFVCRHPRFLSFGLLLTFFSGFGQTFYIALYSADLRQVFELSHGSFGLVYSLATLTSAVCLIYLGRKLDDVDLRLYTGLVCGGFATAALLMAWSPSVVVLYLAIFGLRLTGQGLFGHIAITSMARYFPAQRGKAISIAGFGHPLSEAIFPLTAVALVAWLGWREMWAATALFMALAMLPLFLVLLRGQQQRYDAGLKAPRPSADMPSVSDNASDNWTRAQVLRDYRFYLALPAILAPPFINTGVFFHQVHLSETKGWPLALFASAFVVYAASTILSSVVMGEFVDRLGSRRFLPVYLLPMALVLFLLAGFDHPAWAYLFMFGAGVSHGMATIVHGALWPEMYGVKHLGAIRALTTSLMVFATALSPVLLGWCFDAQVTVGAVLVGCAVYILVASALCLLLQTSMAHAVAATTGR